jgi:hypothetical protein
VANAVRAAWAGGDTILTPAQIAGSLFPMLGRFHCPPAEIKVIAPHFFPIDDHFQLSSNEI